jgi:hypothetical protein
LSETIRGGGHVGPNPWFGYQVGWPMASLTIAPDSLTLSMWPVQYKFERHMIQALVKKRWFGWQSLFIVHTNPAFSKSVFFQPLRFSRLESALTQNGYALTSEAADLSAEPNRYLKTILAIALIVAILGVIAAFVAMSIARRG